MHMSIAIVVAYLLSGSWGVALAIGLIEPCIQTVAFFFHERAWHRVELRQHTTDHHNSIIDSTSPAAGGIEELLRDKQP